MPLPGSKWWLVIPTPQKAEGAEQVDGSPLSLRLAHRAVGSVTFRVRGKMAPPGQVAACGNLRVGDEINVVDQKFMHSFL